MDQPRNRDVPNTLCDMSIRACGLRCHGPIGEPAPAARVAERRRRSRSYSETLQRRGHRSVAWSGRGTQVPVREHGWRPAPLSDNPSRRPR